MFGKKIPKFVEKNAGHFLAGLLIISGIVWTIITFYKYNNYFYNSLDLAIFSQVFWNNLAGNFFENSIQNSNYLGDHFAPFILLLTPFYALWKDPRLLLLLQTLTIHLATIPLYFLARNLFRRVSIISYPKIIALVIALAYILNPLVQNALMFEFHLLPFFLLPFFIALYFAEQKRFWPTMIALLFALTVREDIPLVVAFFGLATYPLYKTDSRKLRWILAPLLISALWFVLSLGIISQFSPAGEYKFAVYYGSPSGNTATTILNFLKHPAPLIQNFLQFKTLIIALSLLVPVGLTPLLAPRVFMLALLPFLQFTTVKNSGLGIIILHYGILFVPALFLGVIYATLTITENYPSRLIKKVNSWPISNRIKFYVVFIVISSLYGMLTLGPLGELATQERPDKITNLTPRETINTVKNFLLADNVIVASNRLLASLTKKQVYPLYATLRGTKQFSSELYEIPKPIDALVLDQSDIYGGRVIVVNGKRILQPYLDRVKNFKRLRQKNLLVPTWSENGIALFTPSNRQNQPIPLVTVYEKQNISNAKNTPLIPGSDVSVQINRENDNLYNLIFNFNVKKTPPDNYVLQLKLINNDNNLIDLYYFEPGWVIYPSSTWESNSTIESHFRLRSSEATEIIITPILYNNVKNLIHGPWRINKSQLIKTSDNLPSLRLQLKTPYVSNASLN